MRRMNLFVVLAMVAGMVGLVAGPAHAATLVVDDDGLAVSGDCDALTPTPHSTISSAIAAAVAGDTIEVCPGTYAENVTLNKDLTLNGAQAGVDARGRVASESTIAPPSGNGINLVAGSAGATIDGFTVSGGTSSITSGSGPINGVGILNNRLMGFTSSGTFMNDSGTDMTFNQNAYDAASKVGGGGLAHFDTDNFDGLHFTNNTVQGYGGGTGFFVDGNNNMGHSSVRQPLLSGNLLDGAGTGMNLGSRAFEAGIIMDNTFSNNGFDGLQGGMQLTFISLNVFMDNGRSGIAFTSFGNIGGDRGAQHNDVWDNEFSGNGSEAMFFSSAQSPGTISTNEVHSNNIEGNTNGAVYSGTETINVDCNWWGDASGPTAASNPPGSGDTAVGAGLDFTPWLTAPAPGGPCDGPLPTAMERKESVRDSLATKQGAADEKDAKRIGKAIEHIDHSLNPDYWEDDTHLDPKDGDKVFKEEQKAVKELMKVENTDVSAEILELVDIDRDLAETEINESPPGKERTKAEEELAKGDAEAAEGKYDKAIEHYRKAWENAIKAQS